MKEKRLIHIYYGDGKGKTTCAIGLCIRAAGAGLKVLIYQFLKDNSSSERNILEKIENITLMEGRQTVKFVSQMNEQERHETAVFYEKEFDRVSKKAVEEDYDVILFDEILHLFSMGLMREDKLFQFIDNNKNKFEVILTGYNPSEQIIELADYVSHIKKQKHPFDSGVQSRFGIEK